MGLRRDMRNAVCPAVKLQTVDHLLLTHLCAVQYRTTKNYVTGAFLGPRIGDKIVFSLLIFT